MRLDSENTEHNVMFYKRAIFKKEKVLGYLFVWSARNDINHLIFHAFQRLFTPLQWHDTRIVLARENGDWVAEYNPSRGISFTSPKQTGFLVRDNFQTFTSPIENIETGRKNPDRVLGLVFSIQIPNVDFNSLNRRLWQIFFGLVFSVVVLYAVFNNVWLRRQVVRVIRLES
jgi:hypothetical protein